MPLVSVVPGKVTVQSMFAYCARHAPSSSMRWRIDAASALATPAHSNIMRLIFFILQK